MYCFYFFELSIYFYEWTTNLKEISIIMFQKNTWVKQKAKQYIHTDEDINRISTIELKPVRDCDSQMRLVPVQPITMRTTLNESPNISTHADLLPLLVSVL